ncbi:Gfo/Idh/MocA family oxidoreductase [Dyadobacter sp. CY107]|uniref:Gfo/Idh/MocA family protein n=1 Tax=Dyadobacter fanqingshengii TaxID=2906443 RepID=UPI001F2E831E|nr:Gfo/Idh/MocA family oxidoreductase [Dyadobacter fanqingshengii]MCF2505204.1 Gfo/Idh/MocA family oxidoreductase [Dyadobacter fanqingshengii]
MVNAASLNLDYLPVLPKNKSIGIGCIGSGFIIADCHLVAYRNAGLNTVAIASRNRANSQAVADRHGIGTVYDTYLELLQDPKVNIVDVAVPPQLLLEVVKAAVKYAGHIKGILAQKPLGINFAEAQEIVRLCEEAGIALGVNQNMRYDQSIRACKDILDKGYLGKPVFASIDMRAIPHWMPWQKELGWATLRTVSIHHLDTFRFLFGDPQRVYASVAQDPRNAATFAHEDGIALYILEYENGFRASAWDDVWTGPAREGAESDIYVKWRVEGTEGMAKGEIGWPDYPLPVPSTMDFTTTRHAGWQRPRWKEVWFPDAFAGPMAQLICAVEENREPDINGKDNLKTMALVEACYQSFREHRAIEIDEIIAGKNVQTINH